MCCVAFALPAASQTATAPFQEFFDSSSTTGQWTIKSSTINGLRWWNPADASAQFGTTPGLFVRNDGTSVAYAPWPLSNAPFNFQFDVYPVSVWQKQQPGGVLVALTTGIPGSMSSTDTSIVVGFMLAGPMVDIRAGELTSIFSVPNNAAAFVSGSLSHEWRWMQGGQGGTGGAGYESFPWPQASNSSAIPYWRWSVQVARDASDNLTWNIYTDQYKAGSVPYYTYRMAIPAAHVSDNFRYVSLLTLGPSSSVSYQTSLKINNMRGWAGTPANIPIISSITPGADSKTFQAGKTIVLTGANFTGDSPYTLRIGQSNSLRTVVPSFVNSTTLTAVLPREISGNADRLRGSVEREATGGTYGVHLLRNGIDTEYYPGISYSPPVVYQIDPFEVPVIPTSPEDGTVQFYGAGFDPTSTVTIGGSRAQVTYVSPLHLSVVVPAGAMGSPRIVVTSAKGTITAYDSSVPGTYPPSGKLNFGYASHPYLQFNANTLPAIQARWTDPNFANYVNPVNQTMTSGTEAGSGPAGEPDFWDLGFGIPLSGKTDLYPAYKTLLASDTLGQNLPGLPGLPLGELNRLQFTVPYANWSMYLYNYAAPIAQFYDQFFPVLTPTERSAYLTYLQNAIGYYHYAIQTNDNQVTGSAGWPNRVAIANGGAGVVALSLINSLQSVRGYAIGTPWIATTGRAESTGVVNVLKAWFKNAWTADGGYAEGPLYAYYGTGAALIFTHALENTNNMLGVSPADGGMFSKGSYYENFQNWVSSLWDGTQWSTFDDSQPVAEMIAMLLDADNRFGLPNLTHLSDYIKSMIVSKTGIYGNTALGASSGDRSSSYSLMWRNSQFPSSFTGFPTLQVNASVQQAALRSDSSLATPFYIGIKGSSSQEVGTNLHHENDTASFVVQSKGELFLIDPGYYLPNAANHSLLVIDGISPGTTNASVGVMDATANLNNTAFRSATIDATHAYAGVSSFRRVFTMYSNGFAQLGVILEDVQTPGAGSVTSYYQSGQFTRVNGKSGFTLTGNLSKLLATFDGPTADVTSAAGTPSFHAGPSWIYDALSCQFPADNWCTTRTPPYLMKYTTIRASYTALASAPFITLVSPAGIDGSGSTTATVDRATPGIINVNISDGSSIQFSQKSGVWRVNATGLGTAAQ